MDELTLLVVAVVFVVVVVVVCVRSSVFVVVVVVVVVCVRSSVFYPIADFHFDAKEIYKYNDCDLSLCNLSLTSRSAFVRVAILSV